MSLTPAETKKIAHLARLSISDEELDRYTQQLSNIFNLIAQMETVNTDDIEPMSHAMDAIPYLRKDEVTEINNRDNYLKLAPQTEAGLYLVPKVIE